MLLRGLGRLAGPGGDGGGGVGTRRVVSADPCLLGTFQQTREVPLGGTRSAGSPHYGLAASALSLSGVEPGLCLAPRKAGALSAALAPAGLVQSHGHSAFPSSGPAGAHLRSVKQGRSVPSDLSGRLPTVRHYNENEDRK